MIWKDSIADILDMVNGSSFFDVNRSTLPTGLGLKIINRAKDHLCMCKPWRDLLTEYQAALDVNKQIVVPADFGMLVYVYADPSGIGKPTWNYFDSDIDVSKRYRIKRTFDTTLGHVRALQFPTTVYVPANPVLVYSQAIPDYTGEGDEISFFPINLMLTVCKKLLQDFYGASSQDDPNWILRRYTEEMNLFEGYAYQNNAPLDMQIKDYFGNPVRIIGASLDGSQPSSRQVIPFLPSTFYSGGTM
jgi:hypothetical protein